MLNSYDVKMGFRMLTSHPSLISHIPKGRADFAAQHIKLELQMTDKLGIPSSIDQLPSYRSHFCGPMGYLYALCRIARPQTFVETGVHYGNSSSYILKAMRDNQTGELYSIDLPKADVGVRTYALPNRMTTGFLIPEELRSRWKLVLGDAKVELPKLLEKLGAIDMFMHDSLHTYEHMTFEFETAWKRLKSGGFLLSDDIDYNAAFSDFSKSVGVSPLTFGSEGVLRKP